MTQLKPTKTVYTVSDFLDWQRNGSLQLKPIFQRREVWSSKAKSLLVDTVVKGLPVPIVFLRKTQDLDTLTSRFEVVDGQQRLRTLFSFIDPSVLSDRKDTDDFTVLAIHNPSIADSPFRKLSAEVRESILSYEISTHVFPPNTSDEVVLRIFARINSTGAKLNHQELRNAEFFGAFKTLVYDIAIRNLPLWRKWAVFDDDDFARMVEAESVSDYVATMMTGLQGKSQPRLHKLYKDLDEAVPGSAAISTRFQRVMDDLDEIIGDKLPQTRLRRPALFYSLFAAVYDHVFGLGSDLESKRTAKKLPSDFAERVTDINKRIVSGKLPDDVLDAMVKATADLGRRRTRHRFLMERLGLVSAK